MSNYDSLNSTLETKFDRKRIGSLLGYYSGTVQKFDEGDWENSLIKAGKFIETAIKMILVLAGEKLPEAKKFKASVSAQGITQLCSSTISDDGIRLQIPRACIYIYDIISNRGGRHDSDKFNPNESDAITVIAVCSWILAEFIRFCSPGNLSPEEAKKNVDSLVKKHYPIFEEIDGRIWVDKDMHNSASQCALMILYRSGSRMSKEDLTDAVIRHKYKKSNLRFERLDDYVDVDEDGNLLLRTAGRKRVEQFLNK